MSRRRLFALSIGWGILLAVAYGIVHDQITARICIEYFTVWHPPLVTEPNPTLVGLVWGVVATWWVGAILGALLAFAATAGARIPATLGQVRRSMAILLVVSGACAALTGLIVAKSGFVAPSFIAGPEITALGMEKLRTFSICLAVHNVSYNVAFVGALVAAFLLFRSRPKPTVPPV